MRRKPYPSDVTDDEWAFVAPYLTLMKEDAPQRDHPLREVFNGLRWIVRTGAQWPRSVMPNDLPPWHTVYQQSQVVNGKSAIEWVMERYQVTTHAESGITNDPNDWAAEVGNPRYILDLLLSVIHVSVQTVEIVGQLPRVKFE